MFQGIKENMWWIRKSIKLRIKTPLLSITGCASSGKSLQHSWLPCEFLRLYKTIPNKMAKTNQYCFECIVWAVLSRDSFPAVVYILIDINQGGQEAREVLLWKLTLSLQSGKIHLGLAQLEFLRYVPVSVTSVFILAFFQNNLLYLI